MEMLNKIIEDLRKENWVQALLSKSNLFVVGGSARDSMLNKPIKDIDLVCEGLSFSQIKDILEPFGKNEIVGEAFSVLIFKPKGHKGEPFEIATPRIDRKIGEGHKGFEVITEGVDILTDLKRRDFTVNSIAANISTGEILDPFNGLTDIENKLIRATDETAFVEDPLRILRGIQFASRFGFKIDDNTMSLMKSHSKFISEISGERIFDEFIKIIKKQGDTQVALNLIHETDTDLALFGEKMNRFDKGFESLDETSFFYILGVLGHVNPGDFLKKRLKGDSRLEKNVRVLEHIFTSLPLNFEEEDLKFMLFKAFNKAPDVMKCVIFPEEVDNVILDMRIGKIPLKIQDIQINGNDVLAITKQKGKIIGKIMDKILKNALMNNFNWVSRIDSLQFLSTII